MPYRGWLFRIARPYVRSPQHQQIKKWCLSFYVPYFYPQAVLSNSTGASWKITVPVSTTWYVKMSVIRNKRSCSMYLQCQSECLKLWCVKNSVVKWSTSPELISISLAWSNKEYHFSLRGLDASPLHGYPPPPSISSYFSPSISGHRVSHLTL